MNEQGKQKLSDHLERCHFLELEDDYHCVEVRADRLAARWATSGRVGTTFGLKLAQEHSRWVLKHDKELKERYLSEKKTKAA